MVGTLVCVFMLSLCARAAGNCFPCCACVWFCGGSNHLVVVVVSVCWQRVQYILYFGQLLGGKAIKGAYGTWKEV